MAFPVPTKFQTQHLSFIRDQVSQLGDSFGTQVSSPVTAIAAAALQVPALPTFSFVDNSTRINIANSTTHVHGSKKESKESNHGGWALVAGAVAIVFAFLAGRSIKGYQTAVEVRQLLVQPHGWNVTALQFKNVTLIKREIQSVETNRLWSLINRVIIAAGGALTVLAYLYSAPLALGATLIIGGLISGAVRLGYHGFESSQAKIIQTALSNLSSSLSGAAIPDSDYVASV